MEHRGAGFGEVVDTFASIFNAKPKGGEVSQHQQSGEPVPQDEYGENN